MNRKEQIEQLAAQWVSRSDSPDWSERDQASLEAWLSESTEHRVAWLRLRSVWRRADRLAALAPPPHARPRRGLIFPQRLWLRSLAATVAIAVLLGTAWHHLEQERGVYVTGVGGRQTVPLNDGSRLELNTLTQLRAEVDTEKRAVWLERGEAYFEIKHDPRRPFVVYAGKRRVTVLGTKFTVRREKDRFEVAVVEGRVRVDEIGSSKSRPPAIVNGGDILFAKSSGTLVATNSSGKVVRDLSWRQGMLVFEQSTLAEAAAEFNRYNRKQLVLVDEQTAGIRIGGNFDANGVEAFVRLLERGFSLNVEERGEEIRVSRHPPPIRL